MGVLSKREAEIPLNGGMDTESGAEYQAVSTLRDATNLRSNALGELEKRPDNASTQAVAATGGSYAGLGASGLVESRDGVYAITDHYGVVTSTGDYVGAGRHTVGGTAVAYARDSAPKAARVSRLDLDGLSGDQSECGYYMTAAATCVSGTVLVTASLVSTTSAIPNLWITARSLDTGALIAGPVQVVGSAGTVLWWVDACENTDASDPGVLISFASGSGAPYTLYKYRYKSDGKTFVSDGAIKSDLATVRHKVATSATAGRFYLAYEENAGNFLYAEHAEAGTYSAVTTHTGNHSASGGIDIVVGTAAVMIASAELNTSPAIYAESFGDPSNRIVLWTEAANNLISGVAAGRQTVDGEADCAAVWAGVTVVAASPEPTGDAVKCASVDFSGTIAALGSASAFYPSIRVVGLGTSHDGRAYAMVAPSYPAEPTSPCLVRHEHGADDTALMRPVARFAHGIYHEDTGTAPVFAVGDCLYSVLPCNASADDMPGQNTQLPQSLVLACADLSSAPVSFAQHSGVALVATGVPFDIDGRTAGMTQPHHRPIVTIDSASGTGTTWAQGVSVIAIYRWYDAAGRLHRSEPSAAVSSGAVTNKQVNVYVTRLALSPFYDEQRYVVELYVTENNGSTYYLANQGTSEVRQYDTLTDCHQVFQDIAAGTSADPILYTSGAGNEELASESPPAFLAVVTVGDRMWGLDAEDRSRVWPSKPLVSGIAPEWNTANTLYVGDEGTGISDVGGVPTVFCKRGIWQIYGEGPNSLGVGSFAPARRLPHEVECMDGLSVCKTPVGVVFRSRKGVVLLDAKLQLQAIGSPIESRTSIAGTPSGFCRISYDQLSDELYVLDFDASHYVFHLTAGKWSEWTQSQSDQYWTDCLYVAGNTWYLHSGSSADEIRKLDSVQSADRNETTGTWTLQTPWVSFDGVAGNLRVWEIIVQVRVGTSSGTSTGGALTATYETREGDTESFTWSAANIYTECGGVADQVVNLRCRVSSQRTKRFRVTLAEAAPGYAYAGHVPVALRVAYGATPGGERKVSTTQDKGSV